MNWQQVEALTPIKLNIGGGKDSHPDPLYSGYVSVDLDANGDWGVAHDLRQPIPLADNTVQRILTEHFLEHITANEISAFLVDAWRLLEPGGLLRLAVPDYHSPRNRKYLEAGHDPTHTDHVTFTTYPLLRELVASSPFRDYRFYQYWDGDRFVNGPIDYSLGHVKRTVDHDPRNARLGVAAKTLGLFRDLGWMVSRGFVFSRNELQVQRGHPLRMTSIVCDLRKDG